MSRITDTFDHLKSEQRVALIPFITAGDPEMATSLELMHSMVDAGADLLELGIPFSDPMADGPVIQRASERSLAAGTTTLAVFGLIQRFRQKNQSTPIILMGYLNPVEAMGVDIFAQSAAKAGADGAIIVDLPPEEGVEVRRAFTEHNLDLVYLIAPTTTNNRIKLLCEAGSGFVYYVSVRGVTGSSSLNVKEIEKRLAIIKSSASIPVGVGFGIDSPEIAARVASISDAVIIGSAIVGKIEQANGDPGQAVSAVHDFVGAIHKAITNINLKQATG